MSEISVILHLDDAGPGHLATALESAGLSWSLIRVAEGERPPPGSTAIVILGGDIGAYETEDNPFLHDETVYLRKAIDDDVPILGICLGAQILAAALGGRAYKADRPEVGLVDFQLSAAGALDSAMNTLDGPMVGVHQDTFDLPSEARLLASNEFPQAFRFGSALGVQFHPEVDSSILRSWLQHDVDDLFRRAEVDPEHFIEEAERRDAELKDRALRFFDAWLADAGLI